MSSDNRFKSFGWIFDIFQHGILDVSVTNNIGIGLIFFLSLDAALFMLKSRLIEVDILAHDDRLDRY